VDAPKNTQAGFMRTSDGNLVVSLLNDTNVFDWREKNTMPRKIDPMPDNFDATIILREGEFISAKIQPENVSLDIQTVDNEKHIQVNNIGMHTLVVMSEEEEPTPPVPVDPIYPVDPIDPGEPTDPEDQNDPNPETPRFDDLDAVSWAAEAIDD
jgi:hypothetical protein